jgi:regulatory protein
MRYLAMRPRSRHELERRLRRSGATDDVVVQVLDRLAELGLADDLAFARWWQEQRDRHAPRGRRLLAAELRQRGVGPDVLAELDDEIAADDDTPITEEDRARAALERHLRGRPLPVDPRALQRLGAFLVRRGFTPETARTALRAAFTSSEVDLGADGE